jgi:TRAP-type C4-dicarboxylate transport system permease small subunit
MAVDANSTLSGPGERTGWLKAVDAISTLCGWASAAMILVSVAITCQMIFVRFVLNQSTIWQTEAVTFLMVAATLIGLPYVQKLRGHVNVDLIPLMMRPTARKALALFTLSVSIIIVALMVVYGFEFWHTAWSRNWKSDTVWGVRLWIPYLAMPVGFGLLLLQLVADLAAVVTGLDKPFNINKETR